MDTVCFTDNEYKFIDSTAVVRFTEDGQHGLLLDYVFNQKVYELPALLEQYVMKKMNITTFELNDYHYCGDDSKGIIEILIELHPYYCYNQNKVFVKMLGNYLNATLLQSSYHKGQVPLIYPIYERDWYVERFVALSDGYLSFDDKAPDMFYDKYRSWVGDEDEDSPILLPKHMLEQPANRCLDELWTHETVARMLYWILDISVTNLKELTTSQRSWLYANLFRASLERSQVDVTERLSMIPLVRYYSGQDHTQRFYEQNKLEDVFRPIYGKLDDFHENADIAEPETLSRLKKAVEYSKRIRNSEVYTEYVITDLYQLLFLEISGMISSETAIRKCKRCGRYFVVTNLNMKYCSRTVDGANQPCNAIGSKSTFDEKLKTEAALNLYQKAYRAHYARMKRNGLERGWFDQWKKEAKEQLEEVRAGNLDISEYEVWLKKKTE